MLVSPWRLWTQREDHHGHHFYQLVPVVVLEHSRDPVCYTLLKAWGSLVLGVGWVGLTSGSWPPCVRSPGTSQGEACPTAGSASITLPEHDLQVILAMKSHLLPLASPHLADSYMSCQVLPVMSPLLAQSQFSFLWSPRERIHSTSVS